MSLPDTFQFVHRRDGPRYTAKRVTGTHGKYFEVDNKTGYPVFYTESAVEHFIESEAWEVVPEPMTHTQFMDALYLRGMSWDNGFLGRYPVHQAGFSFSLDFSGLQHHELAEFVALAKKLDKWRKL